MRRQIIQKSHTPSLLNKLLNFLMIFPILLISIGDGIRKGFAVIFIFLSKTYNLLSGRIQFFINKISIYKFRRILLKERKKRKIKKTIIPLRFEKKTFVFPPKYISRIKFELPVPRLFSTPLKAFILGVITTILFIFIPYNTYIWLSSLPNPQLLSKRDLEVTTKLYDRNGVLLYEIYAEQNRTPIPLSEIPEYMKQATIAIEDQDFYQHKGLSLRGISRALRSFLFENNVQGGSTITQQLVKSALLSPEVKLSRKIKEIFLAFWAESIYSKNEILEMYLNQVPYGGTAWGIEAAARTYFGKSARSLSLSEATLLAGLPQAPTEYSPFGSNPQKAFDRQAEVLRRMVEEHYISRAEAEKAKKETIVLAKQRVNMHAPHFVMYVKELLERQYGPRLVERGGLRIKTSLDMTVQKKVEEIIKSEVASIRQLNVTNGAAIVTNPKTGEILAMVGSKDYFDLASEGNVNVTTSLRPPGSTIKVVNYASALESGKYTAASILFDTPITFNVFGSKPYSPVNYDNTSHGPVPLRYALANSYNVPAVKVLHNIGVDVMIEKGRMMGIESWNDGNIYGLSLTLGGGDITMLDMARVFGTLANLGKKIDLLPVLEISDFTGKIIEKNKPEKGIQAVKKEVAWIITDILSDNIARSQAFGTSSQLYIPGKSVAVKTGTSNDKRDNWTIGYTPSFLVTVWVGNNDNTPMHPTLSSGITGAAPIWRGIMEELLKNKVDEPLVLQEGIVKIPCYFGRTEYFIKGTEPKGGRCGPLPTPVPSASPTP